MEQRRLRLGDILDDYCPRERRVTNHAVVAMIEEDVKQTRCTTCDAEHAYKGGKEPRRRKKDAGTVLYNEVLAGMPDVPEVAVAAVPAAAPALAPPVVVEPVPPEASAPREADEGTSEPEAEPASEDRDDGGYNRRLIRATLPRPEGQKEVRQVTDFTIRQNTGRGNGGFRGGAKMRGPAGNGTGAGAGRPRRFNGGGQGDPGVRNPRGGRPGFGGGNPQRGPSTGAGRNRKRSR